MPYDDVIITYMGKIYRVKLRGRDILGFDMWNRRGLEELAGCLGIE